jgi:hypothetical protein
MRFKLLVLGVFTSFAIAAPSVASANTAECDDKACCDKMAACCKHKADHDVVNGPLTMKAPAAPFQDVAVTPVRQTAVVWFHRPVRVGDRMLFGKYIIEHDNDRMARGRPCTHIYNASDPRLPVVAFRCTHLDRTLAEQDTVVLQSRGNEFGVSRLTEFQFAGDAAAHGVPNIR